MKIIIVNRLVEEECERVASFGTPNPIHRHNGHWELSGGGNSAGHAATHEWWSVFQHKATFSNDPLHRDTDAHDAVFPYPSKKRVLIADDDPVVRGSLAAVLKSEGYVIDEARNGVEAVTRTIAHEPDLVLLDLNMPHWDGWTAFGRLDRVTPLLPVVIITARPNQYAKAAQLGVDAFMEKPLNIPVLVQAIRRLTAEDKSGRVGRVTDPQFVTELLASPGT